MNRCRNTKGGSATCKDCASIRKAHEEELKPWNIDQLTETTMQLLPSTLRHSFVCGRSSEIRRCFNEALESIFADLPTVKLYL